jgi:hypothetical protein
MPINRAFAERMRVGLYLRVSTGEQTVVNQERELLEAAKRHSWNVVITFRDEGISGAKGRQARPGFQWPEQGEAEVRTPRLRNSGGVHEYSAKSRKSPP